MHRGPLRLRVRPVGRVPVPPGARWRSAGRSAERSAERSARGLGLGYVDARGLGPDEARARDRPARGAGTPPSAFDLRADELAAFARRLARRRAVGEDPVERERAWNAVAFQAQGVAGELSPADSGTLLRALSAGGVLHVYEGARDALMGVLRRRGVGELRPRRVVRLWVALDRADAADGQDVREFFMGELARALPRGSGDRGEATEAAASGAADGAPPAPRRGPRGAGEDWQRLHALLEASGCSSSELRRSWLALEAATLADGAAVRALSIDGLISSMRAAALASERLGVEPEAELSHRLCSRVLAQAQWLDGWAVSHALLAAARLGAAPGQTYDAVRPTLLQRCALRPPPAARAAASGEGPGGAGGGRGFAQAARVAAALARFDVHDPEVRDQAAAWLLTPLSAARLASLAQDLADAGLDDRAAPKVARQVRARARASELMAAVGADAAARLLRSYAQGGPEG